MQTEDGNAIWNKPVKGNTIKGNTIGGIPQKGKAIEGIPQKSIAKENIPQKGKAIEDIPQKSIAKENIPQKANAKEGIPQKGNKIKSIPIKGITIQDITMTGIMVAVIEVCKVAISFLPNVELTTFWLIMFTLFFGGKIIMVVPVFILIEGTIFGFGLWWVMYLYVWPLLVLVTWLSRKQESVWYWSTVSGAFGFMFGFLCSIPYMVIGFTSGGLVNGLAAGFTWWIAGIPFDLIHGTANFVLMRIMYKPVRRVMGSVNQFLH